MMDPISLILLLYLASRREESGRSGQPYPTPPPGGYGQPVQWGGGWYGPWTRTYPQPQPPQPPWGGWGGWGGWGAPPGPQPQPPQGWGIPPIWGQGGVGVPPPWGQGAPPVPPWPGPSGGQPTGPARPWRRIREGDTAYQLAQRATGAGGRWRELLEANPELTTYTAPNKSTQIKPWSVGQRLYLPPGWEKVADGIEPGLPIPSGVVAEAAKKG